MTPSSVALLVADGRLEPVPADLTAAWNGSTRPNGNIESSATLAATDDSLA